MTHRREIKRNDKVGDKDILGGKFYLRIFLTFLTLLLIFAHQDAPGQSSIDKHLIEGVYYLIVENDLNQAEQEFQAILASDKNHPEAYYFLGRICYERVLDSSVPKSMLREAEKYLSMAHSLGIVYDTLHPNLLGYNDNHRSSNNATLLTILDGFSQEIVAEVAPGAKRLGLNGEAYRTQGEAAFQHQGPGALSSAAKFEGTIPAQTSSGRGESTFYNGNQSNRENPDEFRYPSQQKSVVLPASGGKAVATLFVETDKSGVSDVQILSADAFGFTRKRVYEPDSPIELVSGAKYKVEFGAKKRGVKILTPLAIMGVGITLLLMR